MIEYIVLFKLLVGITHDKAYNRGFIHEMSEIQGISEHFENNVFKK